VSHQPASINKVPFHGFRNEASVCDADRKTSGLCPRTVRFTGHEVIPEATTHQGNQLHTFHLLPKPRRTMTQYMDGPVRDALRYQRSPGAEPAASTKRRRCVACNEIFRPRWQVPHLMYRSAAACQHPRRPRWQEAKAAEGSRTRRGPSAHCKAIATTGASIGARVRNAARAIAMPCESGTAVAAVCKHGGEKALCCIASGTYRIRADECPEFAKMDGWRMILI
jgi:hypothetical protein